MATSYTVNKQKTKTPMPELDPVMRSECFEEVARGYNAQQAMEEAARCLQCPKAPCVGGCPVGVPIPQFLEQVAHGRFDEAYRLVKRENALPAVCGRVCPQETQCEGVCTRGRAGEPVAIGKLERFVADWAMAQQESDELLDAQEAPEVGAAEVAAQSGGYSQGMVEAGAEALMAEPDSLSPAIAAAETAAGEGACEGDLTGYRVAMVGSGPASLTCAGELARRGADVTVFEALHKLGGVLTYGIPEFRLPKSLVDTEISTLSDMGVSFEANSVVGKLYDVDELLGPMGFQAVFVAPGAGLPSYLGIPGEGSLGVMTANELLTRVNLMRAYEFPAADTPVYSGQECVVVGGGNVAMDAARTAKRLGATVTVVYRRGREEMPARAEEIAHAEEEGIRFQLLTNPVGVLSNDDGWVRGVECVSMQLGEPDDQGRRRPVEVPNSAFVIPADMMVVAVGNRTNPLIAQTTPGMEVTSRNLIVADSETGATTKPGVFAGGDAVIGAATVILAMGAGKRAAAAMGDYLKKAYPR
uniref:Dihydropyrimidine dehydrogenase n=1 Tax=Muribaculaceae bacterium Z82 TaxID=2304548 RepID=A0A7C9JQN2_9BACT